MNNTLQMLRNSLERKKGMRDQLKEELVRKRFKMASDEKSLHLHEEAREIIRETGIKTMNQISYHISDITSLALEAVFDNPYRLVTEFVQRRNKTECDLYFERDGNRVDPLAASGVGAVDIASFALRIASWSMNRPHSRNVIILDEPFKCLSDNYQEKASMMLKELSEKLNLQFILISHNPTLSLAADKTFEVSIHKGISKVKEL